MGRVTTVRMWGLYLEPAIDRLDLLAVPVAYAVRGWKGATPVDRLLVGEIDPYLADTMIFCQRYGVPPQASANCVIVAGKRGGATRYAACVVLASHRADVNRVARRHLEARKVSFAPATEACDLTSMEYGGITPFGLPADWPVLVDTAVVAQPYVVVGSGIRRSKLVVPGATLAEIPNATVLKRLGD